MNFDEGDSHSQTHDSLWRQKRREKNPQIKCTLNCCFTVVVFEISHRKQRKKKYGTGEGKVRAAKGREIQAKQILINPTTNC